MNITIKGIYLVTEEYGGKSHLEMAEAALKAGVRIIQYREKRGTSRKMLEEARAIRQLTRNYGALFIVNDRVDIALFSQADGVHLGQEDIPPEIPKKYFGDRLIVGVSVTGVEEALKAEAAGADYVAVSPVFDTFTKEDAGRALGLNVLKEIVQTVRVPVVAIGGINKENLKMVVDAGASAAAVVSAITRSENPYLAACELVQLYNQLRKEDKNGFDFRA